MLGGVQNGVEILPRIRAITTWVRLQRFRESTGIFVDLVQLQGQLKEVDPKTALQYARREGWEMLSVDDVCIASRSPEGLEHGIRSDHVDYIDVYQGRR